ncbi:MAG TPA: ABC transporter permease, partial [Acidimicrobiales bacterium]
MTAVLAICANELRRVVRDRTAAFFVAVLPVVIMIVIGTTFGAVSSDLPVGVVDLDGSAASRELAAALDRSPALDVTAYGDEDDLRTDVRTGRVEGGVVVPAGYGAALGGGATAAVGLLTDPGGATATPIRSAVTGAVGGQARVQAAATFAAEATGGDRAALVDVAAAEAGGL